MHCRADCVRHLSRGICKRLRLHALACQRSWHLLVVGGRKHGTSRSQCRECCLSWLHRPAMAFGV